MNFRIRIATKEDCRDVWRMIMVRLQVHLINELFDATLWRFIMQISQDLAVYEKMSDQVKISHQGIFALPHKNIELLKNVKTCAIKSKPSVWFSKYLEETGFYWVYFLAILIYFHLNELFKLNLLILLSKRLDFLKTYWLWNVYL